MSAPQGKTVIFLLFLSVMFHPDLHAQPKAGIEQYQYLGKSGENIILPILHFEGAKGWYAEARYNYEDVKTFSFYGGKSFSGGENLSWSLKPIIGYVFGNLTAGSAGLNIDLEHKGFFLSAQSQFTVALDKENENFFYNWSELGYSVSDHFYTGVTMQFTRQSHVSDMEPGLLAGIAFNNVSFPVYVFSPFTNANRYFVVGVNYEFTFKKKNK